MRVKKINAHMLIYVNLLNFGKQKFRYFVKLQLFDNEWIQVTKL